MAKEKSITELRDEKNQLRTRSQEIIDAAKKETRMFSKDEEKELAECQTRMKEIDLEIDRKEEENRKTGKPTGGKKRGFSLRKALLNLAEGQSQEDPEAEVIERGMELNNRSGQKAEGRMSGIIIPLEIEKRAAFTAATEAATGVIIDEEQMEMLLPLQAALVLSRAGARMMTGLTANIYWPKFSGANVFWETENAEAKDGAGAFSKGTTYKPERLTAYVDISKQLLIQENQSVEAYVRQAIAVAISQKLEKTAFSKTAASSPTPGGMFAELDADIKGEMTWAKIVQMETKTDLQNALFGNLAYIMHPALIGIAKTKVKDTSGAGGFIFTGNGDGQLNGYRALRTNNIPDKIGTSSDEYGIVFGNWADYFLAQWGGIEMLVDPYTQALKGTVRLIVNSYWNMGFIREESFTIASMKNVETQGVGG